MFILHHNLWLQWKSHRSLWSWLEASDYLGQQRPCHPKVQTPLVRFNVDLTVPLICCSTRNTFYGTRYLSQCYTRFAFNPLFVNWVTSLTPRVTWCHRSRDHWNCRWSFPIGHPLTQCPYLAPLPRYWASNISGSRPWPFRITWRHQSRDHWNRSWSLPIGHPLTPCPYLPPLPRY